MKTYVFISLPTPNFCQYIFSSVSVMNQYDLRNYYPNFLKKVHRKATVRSHFLHWSHPVLGTRKLVVGQTDSSVGAGTG